MSNQTVSINCTLGNEWGWFVDFIDEIEVKDELLKPQVNYSRITSVVTVKKEELLNAIIPSNTVPNNNCFHRLLAELTNLLLLGTLYKLTKKIMGYFNL